MILPPEQPPESPLPKSKTTFDERRRQEADRLVAIRLRMAIWRALDDQGSTTPAEVGAALGMPTAEATRLLTTHRWREDDVEQLQAAADRLGLHVPKMASSPL